MGYGRQRGAWLALLLSLLLAGGLGPVSSARATFPGSNGVLAFERSVSTPAIGVVDEDGRNRIDALIAVGPTDRDPSWRSDASRLAFTSGRDGNEEVYTADANGGDQRRITFDPARDNDPSWSPDGTQIAFMSTRDGNPDISVMNADGSATRRLTTDPAADQQPAWAPDGSLIAFTSSRDGSRDIWVMNPDGSGQRKLTSAPVTEADPSWSPDAKQLAFTQGDPGTFDVFAMNRDGSDAHRLTTSPSEDLFPSWSPDGREIGFTSSRTGTYALYVMTAGGETAGPSARAIGAAGVDENWAPLPPPAPLPPAAPVPVAKQTLNIAPVLGAVTVDTPSAIVGMPLPDPASIPVGSTVHADHAIVALETNSGSQEAPDITAALAGGTTFKVLQPAGAGGETTLALSDPRPSCTGSGARSARRRRGHHGPRLHARTHGHLRTRTRDADASASGTAWTMHLLCDGTLIRVTNGVVLVYDRARGRTIRVAASRHGLRGRRGAVGQYFATRA